MPDIDPFWFGFAILAAVFLVIFSRAVFLTLRDE